MYSVKVSVEKANCMYSVSSEIVVCSECNLANVIYNVICDVIIQCQNWSKNYQRP